MIKEGGIFSGLSADTDLMMHFARHSLDMHRADAHDPLVKPDARKRLLNDWIVIDQWLSLGGRQPNEQDYEKVGLAWKAYNARGVAPSIKLQPMFDEAADRIKKEGFSYKENLPPNDVIKVFDRWMATDDEIKSKESFDYKQAEAFLTEAFDKLYPERQKRGKGSRLNEPQGNSPTRQRTALALAAIWIALAMPFSDLYYKVLNDDILNRLFAWILVSVPAWMPVGWKWLTNWGRFTIAFELSIIAAHVWAILFCLRDYDLKEYVYVPILGLSVFLTICFVYGGLNPFRRRA